MRFRQARSVFECVEPRALGLTYLYVRKTVPTALCDVLSNKPGSIGCRPGCSFCQGDVPGIQATVRGAEGMLTLWLFPWIWSFVKNLHFAIWPFFLQRITDY